MDFVDTAKSITDFALNLFLWGLICVGIVFFVVGIIIGIVSSNKYVMAQVGFLVVGICIILVPAKTLYEIRENEIEEKKKTEYLNEHSLERAVLRGDYDTVKKQLEEGVSPESNYCVIGVGNVVSEKGSRFTPLWYACEDDNYEMAKLLLDYGADPNNMGRSYTMPLTYATVNENHEIMELLLEYGADPEWRDESASGYEKCLIVACRKRDVEGVEILLRYGADPNVTVRGEEEKPKLLEYIEMYYEDHGEPEEQESKDAILKLLKENGAE